jgi:hypothetical protein
MRLLAVILSAAVLAAAGAVGEASAGTEPAPRADQLVPTAVDDHVPAPWHFAHGGGR